MLSNFFGTSNIVRVDFTEIPSAMPAALIHLHIDNHKLILRQYFLEDWRQLFFFRDAIAFGAIGFGELRQSGMKSSVPMMMSP
ncbi:MAG TPA: hypothetical protein VGA27_12340 [Candidatus Binatia bacterium]